MCAGTDTGQQLNIVVFFFYLTAATSVNLRVKKVNVRN